ncbi:MAG: HNH endonuclease, partial [Sphingomonadales bacterium]|nr:HNH endonuclease [Sphingomonadales bacterium]
MDKSGDCWLWVGGKSKAGYGQINVEGLIVYTHRLVYEMAYGPIAAGLEVCHRCDTPACCRPEHLFLGTHQENVTDMITKGRKGKL